MARRRPAHRIRQRLLVRDKLTGREMDTTRHFDPKQKSAGDPTSQEILDYSIAEARA